MHQELSTLRSEVDTRSRVRLVQPKTLMQLLQLENLVVSGERLRRNGARGAEAGDEGRGETEATDRCIQRDERDGPRIATFLDLEDRREKLWKLSEQLNENQV